MDKIDRILQLISDKSDALQIEYAELSKSAQYYDEANEALSQITILNEVYNDVKLIKAEND